MLESREIYEPLVKEVVSSILDGSEPFMVKGEYMGYFMAALCKKSIGSTDPNVYFNASIFDHSKRTQLDKLVSKCSSQLPSNALSSASGLKDILLILVQQMHNKCPDYGHTAYIQGIAQRVADYVSDMKINDLIGSRAKNVVLGVMKSVLKQTGM